MKLSSRIKKLEIKANTQVALGPLLIHIVALSADQSEDAGGEVRRISYGRSEWLCEEGELEEAFIDRALQAARQLHPGGQVVCLGFSE